MSRIIKGKEGRSVTEFINRNVDRWLGDCSLKFGFGEYDPSSKDLWEGIYVDSRVGDNDVVYVLRGDGITWSKLIFKLKRVDVEGSDSPGIVVRIFKADHAAYVCKVANS